MSRHPLCLVVGLGLVFTSAAVTAETTERTVLGWTPSHSVAVHVVERGESMLDGVSQDYYVEATQVFRPDGSTALFSHNEPVGAPPSPFAQAGSATDGEAVRAEVQPGLNANASSRGDHRVVWYARERIDKPNDSTFVCNLKYRVALMDAAARRVFTIAEGEAFGETTRRADEAYCPKLSASPHWSPDGRTAFVLVNAGDTTRGVFATIGELDSLPSAVFTPAMPLAASLTTGAQAEAWTALHLGDYDRARAQFQAANLSGAAALVDALAQKKKATKAVDDAYKSSPKGPRDNVFRAAGYVAAGESQKAVKWIDEAVAKAASYDELLDFAAIFEPVDPDIANQLAVHALSHPTAAQADTVSGWTLLAQGLLDLGQYSKAEEALSKIAAPTPASLAARAAIHLDRRQTKLANNFAEDLLFQNPGDCVAYLLQGRLRSIAGDNNAARALFEAALTCDPGLEEAAFYSADFARLAGDVQRAKEGFDQYLRVAPPRGKDRIRGLRRDVALRWSKRLGRDGVLLTDASCRKGGAGFLCAGTLKNTTSADITDVAVEVRVKGKLVGSATVATIAPNSTAPFGVSFEAPSLADATVTAGRDKNERTANELDAR